MQNFRSCIYCKENIPYESISELEILGIKVYFCFVCQAEHLYFSNDNLASVSLYTTINSNLYRWTMPCKGNNQLWLVKNQELPFSRKKSNTELVKCFDEISYNVNPKNVYKKIKNLLIFL